MDQLGPNPMKRWLASVGALAAILIAASEFPRDALAHAFPSAEQPSVGSTVNAPPSEVSIQFDSPIEPMFANLAVTNSAGDDKTAGAPAVGGDRRQLSVKLKPLAPATYTVKWSVVAADGHRTEGAYTFTVTVAGTGQ
jgi:copper resistance protein C